MNIRYMRKLRVITATVLFIAVVVTRLKNLTSDFSGLQMRNCFISNLTKMELLLDVEKMSVPVVDIEQLER